MCDTADMHNFLLVQKFNSKFSFLLVFFFLLLVEVFKSVTDKNNVSS